MKDFLWSQQTAIALKALLNNQKVIIIINTVCSGVVISKNCFRRLGIVQNREVNLQPHLSLMPTEKTGKISMKLR